MTIIKQDDLIDSIAGALQFISYYHPADFIRAMDQAYQREQNPAARDAIAQILINSRMCAEGQRPICQDTGIVTIFLKVGMNVQWQSDMSVTDMCNEGIRRAYQNPDNILRASILEDPDGARKNTGDNTPGVIHYDIVPGDTVEVHVAAKGGGSEAKSKFAMLNPSDSVVDWVLSMVSTRYAGYWHWWHSRKSDDPSQRSLTRTDRHPRPTATWRIESARRIATRTLRQNKPTRYRCARLRRINNRDGC
jgi:fumarate hydratase class I